MTAARSEIPGGYDVVEGSMNVGGFELRNCVATGTSTQIWEVTEQGSTVQLAMKLMLEEARKKPEMVAVLKHEYKVGSSLEHPSLVRFYKLEVNRDHAFFTMEYFRAPSLKAQITSNLPETQSRFKKICEALCQAYGYMHEKGWLHRDIKPDNILVNKTGEIRIIDFSLSSRISSGIGKLLGGKQKVIKGTRTYIAPETILKKAPTIQSEIYSLGVTLFEVLTGSPPFAGLSPNDLLKKHLSEAPATASSLNPNVTAELDQIILKMLAKKPKDRYADMRELNAAIKNAACFIEDPVVLHERKVKEAKDLETVSVDKRLDSRADADRTVLGLAAPAKPTKGKRKTAPIGELEPVRKAGGPAANAQQPQMPTMMPYAMPHPMMMPMMAHPMSMPPQMMMPQPGMGQPGMPPQMMPQPGMGQPGMPPQMMPQPGMGQPGMPPQMMPQPGMGQPGMPPQMMPQPGMGQPGMPPQMMPQPGMGQPGVPPQVMPPTAAQEVSPPAQAAQSSSADTAVPASEEAKSTRSILLPLERRSAHTARKKSEEDENLDFMTELPDIM